MTLTEIPQIVPTTPEAYQLINEGLIASIESSRQGICIDVGYCEKASKILESKVKISKKKFLKSETGKIWKQKYRKPNLQSGPQLSDILYNELKLKVHKKTDKGSASTDNEVLELLSKDVPEIKFLTRYRKLEKVLNTYLKGFIKNTVDGVMHPNFNLHTTQTFRSSSSDPNFQNIPARDKESKTICRKAIIPRQGFQLMELDFSGIEVVISCCVHKDPKMIKYVKFPEKNNMHTDMAIQIYQLDDFRKEAGEKKLRKATKNGFVFPQFYGDYWGNNAPILAGWADIPTKGRIKENHGVKLMTGKTLGRHLNDKGIYSFTDFENHIKLVEDDFWKNRFKVYDKWKTSNVKEYYQKGYLHMLSGFTCSGIMGPNEINNYPIQGPAFHCNLKSFIKLNQEIKARGLKSRLIGQIHDSMVIDAHPSEVKTILGLVRWIACEWLLKEWPWIIVPMEIEANIFEVDANWASDSYVEKLRAA